MSVSPRASFCKDAGTVTDKVAVSPILGASIKMLSLNVEANVVGRLSVAVSVIVVVIAEVFVICNE